MVSGQLTFERMLKYDQTKLTNVSEVLYHHSYWQSKDTTKMLPHSPISLLDTPTAPVLQTPPNLPLALQRAWAVAIRTIHNYPALYPPTGPFFKAPHNIQL